MYSVLPARAFLAALKSSYFINTNVTCINKSILKKQLDVTLSKWFIFSAISSFSLRHIKKKDSDNSKWSQHLLRSMQLKLCPTSHEIIMDLIQRPLWWSTHYCGTIQNIGTSIAASTTWKDLIEWSEACKLKMNEGKSFFNLCVDWIIYLIINRVHCCSTF